MSRRNLARGGLLIMTKNKSIKKRTGRPKTAHQVFVVPVRQERPDARKLGRALLSLALHQSQLEADAASNVSDAGQGESL